MTDPLQDRVFTGLFSLLTCVATIAAAHVVSAQTLVGPDFLDAASFRDLSFASDLDSLPANWQSVGRVVSRWNVPEDVQTEPGSGVLVNTPNVESDQDAVSAWVHGDIALDFDVLIPARTSSGLLFLGRYELGLADSWASTKPNDRDMGGVTGEAPPLLNVSRAPGLWQHVSVLFRAPRFDSRGTKVSPARFVLVSLNGVVVQKDVDVMTPTRSADADEAPTGPLVFRGDGGPIAFRNARYSLLDAGPAAVSNITYTYYRGDFGWEMPDVDRLDAVAGGDVDSISSALADTTNRFALRFEGDLILPETGSYLFEVTSTGQFALEVDRRVVVDIESPEVAAPGDVPRRVASADLVGGRHSFVLTYARGRWHRALSALGLYVSGPKSIRTRLSAAGSDPDAVFAAYEVDPESTPRLQRNFVPFGGEKRTHGISVGYPNGSHYAYDADTGALLEVWRGRFIDTSTMWFDRGYEQSAVPRGSLIEFSGLPPIGPSNDNTRGPTSNDPSSTYRFRGYHLDASGNPTFSYTIHGIQVSDAIRPATAGRHFERTLTLEGEPGEDVHVHVLVAANARIEAIDDGMYMVGDGEYLVSIPTDGAVLRRDENSVRLYSVVDMSSGSASLRYALIW